MELPFIDVVVPTWNRTHMLETLVRSLAGQNYPPEKYQVIIVDDGSSDDTRRALERLATRHPGLKVIHIAHAGLSAAKNRGWRSGNGEIVAFTDDDCVADSDWLAAIARALTKRPDALGLQGRTVTVPEQVTPFTHQIVVRRPNAIYHGCNVAYRRAALLSVDGFDEAAHYAEDSQLGAAVSAQGAILFCPDMLIIHPPRSRVFAGRAEWEQRLKGWWRLYRRYPDFFRRTRGRNFLLHGIVRLGFLSTAKEILIHLPWLLRDPLSYMKFLIRLLRERMILCAMLPRFWLAHKGCWKKWRR